METITIFARGAAKGHPGPAAIGVQIVDGNGVVLKEVSESVGNGDDNFALYYSVLRGLQVLQEMYGADTAHMQIVLKMDSKLVTKQLNHEEPVTEPGLVPLFMEIHNLRVANFPQLTLTHVPRKDNTAADRLVHEALDAH